MKMKRFFGAALGLFIFMAIYEWLVHGVLLSSMYAATSHVWRSYHEMMAKVPFNIFVQVLIAVWLTFIFTKFFPKGGARNGLRFGLYFGVLLAIQMAGVYYWLPISCKLTLIWFFARAIEGIVGGLILGSIYSLQNQGR